MNITVDAHVVESAIEAAYKKGLIYAMELFGVSDKTPTGASDDMKKETARIMKILTR